jgi:hypothetical protein
MRALREAGAFGRQVDGGDQLAGRQVGVELGRLARQAVELRNRNGPAA